MDLDPVFRAVADPTRRALLDRLAASNGQTLVELCAGLDMARQSVSKHLAVLEDAGLVTTERRGREKLHFLDAAPVHAIADRWLSQYDRRRAAALADLTTALEAPRMNTTTSTPASTADLTEFVYTAWIRTAPEPLWEALTTPEFTERYWGVRLTSDWTVGSTVTWEFAGVTMADEEQVVLASDPPRRLAYTWHTITDDFAAAIEADPASVAALRREPRSRVTFDIEQRGEQCRLVVTHADLEVGGQLLEGISGGWPEIVSSLKSLLETGEPLRAG